MFLAVKAGAFLDRQFTFEKPWGTLCSSILALLIILRLIVQQTRKL